MSILTSFIAAALILWLFVPADLRRARVNIPRPKARLDLRQKRVALLLGVLLALWTNPSVHGISIVLVTLVGTLVLLTPPFPDQNPRRSFMVSIWS